MNDGRSIFLLHALMCAGLAAASGCASEEFHRVETLPEGIQINDVASGMAKTSHTSHVSDRYDAPYADVWAATLRVANRLKHQGVKPVMLVDQARGEIKLRETHIISNEEFDPDELRLRGWVDEFQFQVTALQDGRSKVMVARTVQGIPAFRVCGFVIDACDSGLEPEVSNGHMEDWILTQIEDDLARKPKAP